MSLMILAFTFSLAQLALGIALCIALWRMIAGPRAQDRVLGLDTLYINAMLLLVVTGMKQGSLFFFEAAVVIGMLGFVATVALAKFLMRGEVIE